MAAAQQGKVNLAGAYAAYQRQQKASASLVPQVITYQAPARMRQLDTLLHLSHFSDYLVLITAPLGSGKTVFSQQFLRVQPTDTCVVHLRPEEAMSGPRLVRDIVSQLPVEVPKHASLEQSILALQDLSIGLAANEQVLLIVIDDAHWLEDDALELLANVIPHSAPADARPHVVLFAEPSLPQRFEAPQFKELRQERYYQLSLAPFSQADSREFLRQLVASLELPGDADVHESQLDQLHEMAAGVPGHLDMLMRQALRQGGLQNENKGLPLWHISAIAVVLVALMGLWWLNQESEVLVEPVPSAGDAELVLETAPAGPALADAPAPEPVVQPVLQPLPALEPVALSPEPEYQALQTTVVDSEASVEPSAEGLVNPKQTQQIDQLLEQSKALQQQLQATALAMEAGSSNDVVETAAPTVQEAVPKPVAVAVASKPAPKPAPKPALKPAPKPLVLSDVEQRFMKLAEGRYSLQVLGARYATTAKQFVKSLASLQLPKYTLQLERGGEPWFVVLVGDFADQKEAKKAIATLPQSLRNLQPWARPVVKIQQQLVNKINASGE